MAGIQPTAPDTLLRLMLRKGYPEDFSRLISSQLCTDFTATRMIGYLAHFPRLPLEEVADEMLAILALRDSIVEKKSGEHAQAVINSVYNFGLEPDGNE